MRFKSPFLMTVVLFAMVGWATAQQSADVVQIHGFAGWGYGTTDGNTYLLGTEDGAYDNVNFSLNLNAGLGERLMIAAQAEWVMVDDASETDLDYVFAQWRFANSLFFRVGQVQQPFGIYTEIYDVGTLRPFLNLPQGVYGPSGFIAESYLGAGLTGDFYTASNWTFSYDLYFGQLDTPMYHWVMNFDWQTGLPIERDSDYKFKDVVGGRLVVETPVSGISFGGSFYSGDPEAIDEGTAGFAFQGRRTVVGLQAEFLNNSWWIRSEWVNIAKGSSTLDGAEATTDALYLELAYKITEHWQLAGRYDYQDNSFGAGFDYGPMFDTLNEHRDLGFAVNYWFSPNLVIKCEYHRVEGNRFASPDWDNFWQILLGIDDSTDLFQIGAQFSF